MMEFKIGPIRLIEVETGDRGVPRLELHIWESDDIGWKQVATLKRGGIDKLIKFLEAVR